MVAGNESLIPGSGKLVFRDNIIRFDKVPLITPNGDVLIKELTFEVRSITLLITIIIDKLILGTFWYKCSCLWSERLRKIFLIPHPRRTLAIIRRNSHETAQRKAVLHTTKALHDAWLT